MPPTPESTEGGATAKPARLFVLHDSDETKREQEGAREVSRAEARRLNNKGYGVFHVVNEFDGRRRATNLRRINYYFVEMDEGTKAEQVVRLKRSPLLPSVVVESKRGFHCYWRVRGADPSNWKRIVRWGLVPHFRADPKATDPLRLLRAPGFKHCKADPFEVRVAWKLDTSYTDAQLLRLFPSRQPKLRAHGTQAQPVQEAKSLEPGTGRFWQRVAQLDGREAIRRLSGHWLCNGERFELQEQGNGHANIWRTHPSRLSTGCFVDAAGRLGAVEGGSSPAAWCAWYGHGWDRVAEGLREIFPELGQEKDERADTERAGR